MTEWALIRNVEEGLKARLGRGLLLDHVSVTELEKLNYLLKPGVANNSQIELAVHEIVERVENTLRAVLITGRTR